MTLEEIQAEIDAYRAEARFPGYAASRLTQAT